MQVALVFGLFGLIIGSFLNVAVLRRGARTILGRSACMSCGSRLEWYDNIPLVSWLMLRGRCRACGSRISAQYILVEFATGAAFAVIGAAPVFGLGYKAIFCVIAAALVAIAAYDMRHTIIPDGWVYFFDALALLAMGPVLLLNADASLWLYLAAGPAAALPLFMLWLVSGGRWMGLGDAKLALGIGWLLGPVFGIVSVFFAFIIGALVSVCILLPLPYIRALLRGRGIARLSEGRARFTMKSEVPFGPFLIASCFLLWFALLYNIPLPL